MQIFFFSCENDPYERERKKRASLPPRLSESARTRTKQLTLLGLTWLLLPLFSLIVDVTVNSLYSGTSSLRGLWFAWQSTRWSKLLRFWWSRPISSCAASSGNLPRPSGSPRTRLRWGLFSIKLFKGFYLLSNCCLWYKMIFQITINQVLNVWVGGVGHVSKICIVPF